MPALAQPVLAKAAPSKGLRDFAWWVLGYNVLVILWGAVVRATGSGAGCGKHWPLCNGQVIPQSPQIATVIEFTHRAMTGATIFLVLGLLVWTLRATPRRHLARVAAIAATLLLIDEAFLGALLVKLGYVVNSLSPGRFIVLPIHLANTLLLLAALALTASFLSRDMSRESVSFDMRPLPVSLLGLAASILAGVTGSLAALGDTLFPSASLSAAISADLATSSNWLVRLRWLHPASALVATAFVLWLVVRSRRTSSSTASTQAEGISPGAPSIAVPSQRMVRLGTLTLALLLSQIVVGVADVLLLAPTWMQILHLLGADLYWISLVLLASESIFHAPLPARSRNG